MKNKLPVRKAGYLKNDGVSEDNGSLSVIADRLPSVLITQIELTML